MVGEPWRWLFGWRVLTVVAAEGELQVPRLRSGSQSLNGWRTLALVIRMEGSDSGCDRGGTAGPSATLGMTKFKWLASLGVGYSDGGFYSGCGRGGTAGPSATLGVT